MADTQKEILIKIKADSKKATNEIKNLNAQIKNLDKQNTKTNAGLKKTTATVNKMGASFRTLGEHLARVAIYYGSFKALSSVITTFADFESQIKQLGAVSGASATEMEALTNKSRDLGETTIFTATQVAESMTAMARSGLSVEQQMASIDSVLNLSVATNTDLAETTELATRAMHGFGLEATDMGIVSDVMARGANDAAMTISDLGRSFAKVAPVASQFNNTIIETTAVLGVLHDAGIKTERAGTQAKIAMLRLSANTKVVGYLQELADEAGMVSIKMRDAHGNVLPFTKQLGNLKTALAKVGKESADMHLVKIAGTEAVASVQVLIRDLDKVDEKINILKQSFGYSAQLAQKLMKSLANMYKELQSALLELSLKMGTELEPILKSLVQDATDFVRALDKDDIDKFANAIGGLLTTMSTVAEVTAGIVMGMVNFATAVQEFTGIGDKAILLLGVMLLNLKKVITTMKILRGVLLTVNPLFSLLAITLIAVSATTDRLEEATKRLNKTTAESVTHYKDLKEVMDDTLKLDVEKSSITDVAENLKHLNEGMKESERLIREYKKEIDELNSTFLPLTSSEKDMIVIYKEKIEQEKIAIANIKLYIKENVNAGIAVQARRLDEIKALNEVSDARHQISLQSKKLDEDDIKAIDKIIAKTEDRVVSAEKTLGTLKTKERRYADDLIKLEQKVADTRKKYADDRLKLQQTYETKISDLKVNDLSDLEKYNDAQLRADEALAKSKEAYARGNLVMSQSYLEEAKSLSDRYAGEEISHEVEKRVWDEKTREYKLETIKKVDASSSETTAEALKDAEDIYNQEIALSNALEAREIAKINNEIKLKKVEMALTSLQVKLQIKNIELMGKMIAELTGIEYKDQFTNAKAELKEIETQIADTFEEQRELKIKPTTSDAEIANTANEIEQQIEQATNDTNITPTLDTTELEGGFTKFEKSLGSVTTDLLIEPEQAKIEYEEVKKYIEDENGIVTELDINTITAQSSFDKFTETVTSQPIVPIIDPDDRVAYAKDATLRSILGKTIHTTRVITTVYQNATQQKKLGGIIEPNIQKFNEGGHARKEGKLGGYGGGDKVKALLEAGEFIVRKEAVKALGLDRLYQINQGQIPKYQTGGIAGQTPIPRFATGGSVTKDANKTVNINMNLGGKNFALQSDENVANQLANYLKRIEF